MVVGHEHDIKQLLALGVNLPESCVHGLQRLQTQIPPVFKDGAASSAQWDESACGCAAAREKNLITHCAAHAWHDLTHGSDSQHVCTRSEAAAVTA